MEDKEFSLSAFFLVSGISFIGFSKIIQFLDGVDLNWFTWIGVGFLIAGSVASISKAKANQASDN
jgi:hypothetical protein